MYRHLRSVANISAGDAVAVFMFDKMKHPPAVVERLDSVCAGALQAALKRAEFSLAKGEVTTLTPVRGPSRVYLIGLGEQAKYQTEYLRQATAKLIKLTHAAKLKKIALHAGDTLGSITQEAEIGRALADGLALANFEFESYKGSAATGKKKSEGEALNLEVRVDPAYRASFERGLVINESVNLTRTLAATPPNVAHPAYIAATCRSVAKQVGLKCRVIDHVQAKKLGMGGLTAVGSAGSTPPCLILLEWAGTKKTGKTKPVMLVGKAITFDTGGYSIKPADNMDKMKYDKCGGMAVIGAMHAMARLKLPQPVVGVIPCAENMISERGYRPGDIIKFINGVTCEVTNTDAEGRLILADALAYGCKTYDPQSVVDLATLTGGIVVALGTTAAGCFCSDASFRSKLFDAADFTGDRLWHFPLWQEHREQIKGTHGDIVNSAGREAHPIQGAAFLSYFVTIAGKTPLDHDVPWAHLDIAGVADVKKDTPLFSNGPTGFGVRLLVRMLEMM